MAARQNSRTIGDDKCVFHPGKQLIYECKDCPGELACMTCVTTIHQKHELVDIEQNIREKTVKIQSFIKNTKENTLPEIVKETESTIASLKEKEEEFKEEIRKVKIHGERMKERVDVSTAEKVSTLESILKTISDILRNHHRNLENLQQKLENNTKEYENTVKSGTDVSIHDREFKIARQAATFIIPKIPSVATTPTFIPCKDPKQHIERAFGEITEDKISTAQSVTPQQAFLDQPKTLYNVNTSYSVGFNSMSATLDNMAWLYGDDDLIHLIDEAGEEKQTLKPDVQLFSICTHPVTGTLYCNTWSDTIRQVDTRTGTTSVMFHTVSSTWSIGCTTDDHLVITHPNDSKICVYNFTGDIISTYNYTGYGNAEVSVCHNTHNIALIQGEGGVTVLNNKLEVMYTYNGQGSAQEREFSSTAVFADRCLLVGDYHRKKVHVIKDGTVIHCICVKEMSNVSTLCVQHDLGVLNVGCRNPNKILCIKYLE